MSSKPPTAPFETFQAVDSLPFVRGYFIQRIPGLDVKTDRETAMALLKDTHRATIDGLGFSGMALATCTQVHGNAVARVSTASTFPVQDCDSLVTTDPGVCLGIYVADCAAVYIIDRHGRGIALAHSGRKGTELGIVPNTITALKEATGAESADLVLQISPCIRPPHYEVDFAAMIRAQAAEWGILEINDCGTCTASDRQSYYSYRREKGETGRLLAILGFSSAR